MKLILFLAIALILGTSVYSQNVSEFYVSPDGNDKNNGTKELPFATISRARDAVSTLNKNMNNDIIVYLRGGNYSIKEPINFSEKDQGRNGHTIRYIAFKDEKPIISGGIKVTNWQQSSGNIFKAPYESSAKLRQLYVNGKRCYMAKGKTIGHSDGSRWGKFIIAGNESWADGPGESFDGVIFSDRSNLPLFKNPELVELHSQSGFAYHIVSLRDIVSTSEGNVAKFQQPYGAIAAATPEKWGCGFYKNLYGPERLFHFENAMELLDEPGEFYFDVNRKELFYYKRPDDDMATAEVFAPVSEGLLILKGKSVSEHIKNIEFSGITFESDHWTMVDVGGSKGQSAVQSVPLQARYYPDGEMHKAKYTNLRTQRAAIVVENADHISFMGNTYQHLGAIAINLGNDASDCQVTCGVFNDLGSAAINVGDARNVYIGDGDINVDEEGIAKNNLISNNYMINCCREYLASPVISVLWAENCEIFHNEIKNTPYSAISVGWGWVDFAGYGQYPASTVSKNNKVNFNIIKQSDLFMHDGGAIYTLGSQPGGEIKGNYINGVMCPSSGNAIYPDQATSGFTIQDNVCEYFNYMWLFIWGKDAKVKNLSVLNNYADKVTGTELNNAWESTERGTYSNWNSAAKAIVDQAGVESGCKKVYNPDGTITSYKLNNFEYNQKSIICPNPTEDLIHIQSPNPMIEIEIFNSMGQVIQKSILDNQLTFTTAIGNSQKGMYLVRIKNRNDRFESIKLIHM